MMIILMLLASDNDATIVGSIVGSITLDFLSRPDTRSSREDKMNRLSTKTARSVIRQGVNELIFVIKRRCINQDAKTTSTTGSQSKKVPHFVEQEQSKQNWAAKQFFCKFPQTIKAIAQTKSALANKMRSSFRCLVKWHQKSSGCSG